jgi:hypothetical protein
MSSVESDPLSGELQAERSRRAITVWKLHGTLTRPQELHIARLSMLSWCVTAQLL